MQAAQLVKPGRIEVREVPDPARPPGPGMAIVRILRAGICGSDIHMFRHGRIGELLGELPMTIGHEGMGVVEEVGPGAERLLVGRRVALEPTLSCGQCEFCLRGDPNLCIEYEFVGLPPHSGAMQNHLAHPARLLEPIPEELTDEQAVMLEPLAIALWAADLGHVRFGRSAAVLGAGVLGCLTMMVLARMGCHPIIASDVLDYRLELAGPIGATHLVNASRQDVAEEVARATEGRGVDVAFEVAGADQTAEQMVQVAAPGGRCVVVGIPDSDRVSFNHGVARRKGLTILMVRRSRLTLRRAIDLVAREVLPVEWLITHRFALADAQQAFDTVANYRDEVLKALVTL